MRTSGMKIAESEERFQAIAGELEPVLTVAVRRTGEYNVGLNVLVVKAEEGHDDCPTATDVKKGIMKRKLLMKKKLFKAITQRKDLRSRFEVYSYTE